MKGKRERNRWLAWAMVSAAVVAVMAISGCQVIEAVPGIAGIRTLLERSLGKVATGREEAPTASGTIEADEIRIASELGGRIVNVYAAKGTAVRAGDLLVSLDATPLLAEWVEAEAAVAAAEADLAVVQAGPRVQETAAMRAVLALSQAQRDGALSAWENALETVRNPQELHAQIAEAQAKVDLAEQGAILAQAELARERLIRDQKPEGSVGRDIANWQVKAIEEKLAAAQADLEAAQVLLEWLWVIRNRPLGLIAQANAAKGRHKMDEADVVVVEAQLDDLLAGPTPEEVAIARAAVRLAQAQADAIRAHQTQLTLTSPVDGVVMSQVLRPGELAAPAVTILTVADLDHVTLVVYVPLNQIGQVQLEQKVQVTVDSFPGRVFSGQVKRIGDQPEFTPRNVATKEERLNTFYAVEIGLPNQAGLLKPGMPADASFVAAP